MSSQNDQPKADNGPKETLPTNRNLILQDENLNTNPKEPQLDTNKEKVAHSSTKSLTEVPEKTQIKQDTTKNTVFGGMLIMTNLCLGTTIFTLALRAKQIGLTWFLVLVCAIPFMNYWSIARLVDASEGIELKDYAHIVEKILGTAGKYVLNCSFLLYCIGYLIAFYVLIFPLIGRFIHGVFYKDEYETFDAYKDAFWGKNYLKYPIIFGYALLFVPLFLLRDMTKLNIPGLIGVVAVIYTIIVVLVECSKYYNYYKDNVYVKNNKQTHVNWVDIGQGFTKDLNFFKCCSTLFAAYSCHTGVYPVYQGFVMQENGAKKMKKAVFYSCILVALLHVLSVTCSFLTDPITPEDLILYRQPHFGGYDVAMNIGKISVALGLFFTAPSMFFSFRLTLVNMFFNGQITTLNNLIITFTTSLISALIACVYDKILSYLNYLGGFVSVIFCYLFPPIMYAKVNGKGWTHWQNILEIGLGVLVAVIGVIAGILTIIDDAKGN